jgi:hypothetical protein
MEASDVLSFWFEQERERWFEKSQAFDGEIRQRFPYLLIAIPQGCVHVGPTRASSFRGSVNRSALRRLRRVEHFGCKRSVSALCLVAAIALLLLVAVRVRGRRRGDDARPSGGDERTKAATNERKDPA